MRSDEHDERSPLGATPRAEGTDFAVASGAAESVTLCLFDADGAESRVPMARDDSAVWRAFVPGAGPGLRYGYRADGEYAPDRGRRCNPAQLLIDPYARAVTGALTDSPAIYDFLAGDPSAANPLDSAPAVPRSVVADPPGGARAVGTGRASAPWRRRLADTVIYELHVKGFTQLHPGVPSELRGTYAGLGHDAAIEHLGGLGVTTVELMPVQHFVSEPALLRRGRTNYWGYNPIAFGAPHAGYSAAARSGRVGGQVQEFRSMVDRLHAAGLEVVLDVVFNHTAEGDRHGPTLCHRGLDNAVYYRLDPDDPGRYVDTTGTGNSVRIEHPRTLRLVLDTLRRWVTEFGVDGFRFDLAASLGRVDDRFDPAAPFFAAVAQDPTLAGVKLIAEPWDVGRTDSYALGRFPPGWIEWNGRYRDTVRDFWRSTAGTAADFATRITGSADLYATGPDGFRASVNFVTAHDGFTLRDLVSYDHRHNDANGENGADGHDDNRSWNCGVEGPTDDPAVLALRAGQTRTFLATLITSIGVPMLLAGDELGRTQRGNNNAYCHDDELGWIDWSNADHDLTAYVRTLLAFRAEHPVLRRPGRLGGVARSELAWFGADGAPVADDRWSDPELRGFCLLLDGTDLGGDDLMLVANAWWEPVDQVVPDVGHPRRWRVAFSTTDDRVPPPSGTGVTAGEVVTVGPRSLTALVGEPVADPGP